MSQQTPEEIVNVLVKDENVFYGKEWTGMTPKDLASIFKKVYRLLPTTFFKNMIHKEIMDLRDKDNYLMGDMNHILNAFKSIPQIDVITHATLTEEAYDQFMIDVENTIMEWNLMNTKFMKSMERKRAKLEELLPKKPQNRIITPHGN